MYFKSLYIILLSIVGVAHAYQPTSAPLSQHGQIQNVQTYSSNPFWNPNGPYNQRMPQVIYVNGADMNAGDCQRTVSALIANVCANMNNCVGAQLSDIRPTVMLQLSRLPGHNYATSCAGYIDSEFENYVKQYGHAGVTNGTVSFPGATTQNPGVIEPEIKNPFEQPTPDWKSDIIERTQELEELQAQNGGNSGTLEKNDFPTTFADLSFSERLDIKSAGYAPYKDKKAYNSIKVPDAQPIASTVANTSPTPTQKEKKNTDGTITPPTPNDQQTALAIFVYNKNDKKPGDEIKLSDIPKLYWSDKCSDHTIWENLDDDAAINVAGRQVFNKYYLDAGMDKFFSKVKNFEYFLDFEEGNNRRAFPGLVLTELGGGGLSPAELVVSSYDKATIAQYAEEFANELKNTACANDNLSIYVVDTKKRSEEIKPGTWWHALVTNWAAIKTAFGLQKISDIRKLEIVAGPFIVE